MEFITETTQKAMEIGRSGRVQVSASLSFSRVEFDFNSLEEGIERKPIGIKSLYQERVWPMIDEPTELCIY